MADRLFTAKREKNKAAGVDSQTNILSSLTQKAGLGTPVETNPVPAKSLPAQAIGRDVASKVPAISDQPTTASSTTRTVNAASARRAPARIASTAEQKTATADVATLRPLGGRDTITHPPPSKSYPSLSTEGTSDRNKPNRTCSARYAVNKSTGEKSPNETTRWTNQPETAMRSVTRLDPLPDHGAEHPTRHEKPDPRQQKSTTRATRIASAGLRKTSEPMRKPPMWAAINRHAPLGKQGERSAPNLTGRTKSAAYSETWSTASCPPPSTIDKRFTETIKRTVVLQKRSKQPPNLIPTSEQNARLPPNTRKAPSWEPRVADHLDHRLIVHPGTKGAEAFQLSMESEANKPQHQSWEKECTEQLDPLPAVSLTQKHTAPSMKADAPVMSTSPPNTVKMRVDVETIVAIHLPRWTHPERGTRGVARLNLHSSVAAQVRIIPAGALETNGSGPKLAKLFVHSGVSVNITAISGSVPTKPRPKTIDIQFRENTQVLLSFLDGPGSNAAEDLRHMSSPGGIPGPASALQNHSQERTFCHSRPGPRTTCADDDDVNGKERQKETPLNAGPGGVQSEVGIKERRERDRGSPSWFEHEPKSQASPQLNKPALMGSEQAQKPTFLQAASAECTSREGHLPSYTATIPHPSNLNLGAHSGGALNASHSGYPHLSFPGHMADREEVYQNFKDWQECHREENRALERASGMCSTDKPPWTATKIVRMSWKGRDVATQTGLVKLAEIYDRERQVSLR